MRRGLPSGLGSAALAYLDAFPAGEVVAFPIDPLDRLGLPVWVVALFPDDARLAGIMPYGVGYGATDEAAVLGGLGEVAEMVWPTLTLGVRPKTRASYRDLVASAGERAVADPLTLCLPAGSGVGHDTVLEWVEAKRWADGASVFVPIDLAAYSAKELPPGYRPFTAIISNGMGAGPDLDWAVGHGLCEILQRDGNGLLFRALDQGVVLDFDAPPASSTQSILNRFAAAGIRAMPKFATDAFGLPNLYCVGVDEAQGPATPIMVTACGEACHPRSRDGARQGAHRVCRQPRAQGVRAWSRGSRLAGRTGRICAAVPVAGRRRGEIKRHSCVRLDARLDSARRTHAARLAGGHNAVRPLAPKFFGLGKPDCTRWPRPRRGCAHGGRGSGL